MRWVRQLGKARQLREASCLASAGRVTRVGETTFSHVNGLIWLAHPGQDSGACAFFTAMRFRFAVQTNIHCVSMWPELSRIPAGFSSARAAL